MSELPEASGSVVLHGNGDTVWLSPGIAPRDLAVEHSSDGQTLLIFWRDTLLVLYGAMGASVATVEFADGGKYSVEELLDLIDDGRRKS